MKKLYEYICRAEVFVAKYTLVAIALLIFGAAMARFFRHPIPWAMDASTFLFGWCVFLSGDAALRHDKLVCIDAVVKLLPKKLQYYIKLFNYIVIALFLLALIGYGSYLSYTTRYRTFQGIPGFSYSWVTISVPIGSLLMLVTTIRKIGEECRAAGRRDSQREEKRAAEPVRARLKRCR